MVDNPAYCYIYFIRVVGFREQKLDRSRVIVHKQHRETDVSSVTRSMLFGNVRKSMLTNRNARCIVLTVFRTLMVIR